ncbi:hypothetical protein MACH10_37810 [Thalassospira tepidiphila]|uniref:TIGR04255 family protein n=1 Tax=Thalassospira tepidiphila TaxID=393657 RepID=UPI00292045A4|nr:hypothetical protein MACH10_37810 [Thalassospira tepidiphila]
MNWKPLHDAHSIEQVRVVAQFKESLPEKAVTKASSDVVERSDELLLPQKQKIATGVMSIDLSKQLGVGGLSVPAKQMPPVNSGWRLCRSEDQVLVEEVAFRDIAFSYFTSEYGRWENTRGRLSEVFIPALTKALEATDLATLRLEYWDSFICEGDLPDASEVINQINPAVPETALKGEEFWHSHCGWFEYFGETQVLVNKNIDFVESEIQAKRVKTLKMYTLVEARVEQSDIAGEAVLGLLDQLHARSVAIFGSSITEPYRKRIDLELKE